MDPNETKIYTTILLGAILLAVLLVFFISTIVRHQRKNALLYEQQIKVEINTLESERKRIATDLHDELGPILSSIKLQINNLNTNDEDDHKIIDNTSKYIDEILVKVRETSNDLMPNVLIRKGLEVAIKQFAENINRTNALKITTEIRTGGSRILPEKEIHLYRIVQEAFNNAMKHSGCSEMKIRMAALAGRLELIISDNGKGFNYQSMSKNSLGFGLKSIVSRVDILDGELYLDTANGKGTIYTIIIPL